MDATEIARVPHSDRSGMGLLESPIKVLQDVSKASENGYLQVQCNDVTWRIYFRNGKLQYACSSFQSLMSLDYHFRCIGLNNFSEANQSLSQAGLITQAEDWLLLGSANPALTWFRSHGFLNILQGTQLLENLTKEAIESFLWLTTGHYRWVQSTANAEPESVLEPNLELPVILQHFQKRMRLWQQLNGLIQSPHQRPYLFAQGSEAEKSPDLLKLSKLLRGMSIRELALVLNQDELRIAKLLCPFIQRGEVYLRDPKAVYRELPKIPQLPRQAVRRAAPAKVFKIACIDDSPTILDEMQRFLHHDEYEVTKIDDPVKAASLLFRLKPDLILMDITMPEINGYKLCSLLRNSVALRETPIVMVTGRSGLIDKARAKVTGATDYLVKPFTRGTLLAVVEKYLR